MAAFPSRRPESALAGPLCAAVLACAGPARAQNCPVVVVGEAPEPWREAVRHLHPVRQEVGDCAHVEVEVLVSAARLTFITGDGRRAERVLTHPRELAATLAALHVTLPGVAPPVDPDPDPAPLTLERRAALPAPAGSRGPTDTTAETHSNAPSPDRAPVFSLQGGARAGAGHLVSAVLAGNALLALSRWELGITGGLELQYVDVEDGSAPGSAANLGVVLGRREPVGAAALVGAARLIIAALNDERDVDTGERGGAELRLGASVGLVYPREAALRFRLDLGGDVVPHHGTSSRTGELASPWWGITALLGAEIGGP